MKKIFLKIVIGVVLACILFVCFLYTNNEIGVTSSKLEADIRSSQKIKDDWTVDGSVSSTMAAYISYPQDLSDHSFSVYVNRIFFPWRWNSFGDSKRNCGVYCRGI